MELKNFAKIRFKDRLLYLKESLQLIVLPSIFSPQSNWEELFTNFKFRFSQSVHVQEVQIRNKALEATLSQKISYIGKDFRLNQAYLWTLFNFAYF